MHCFAFVFALLCLPLTVVAQSSFDGASTVFRLDGGATSYVFGVNERRELQSLYWGERLGAKDRFPPTPSVSGPTGFEATTSVTPQEVGGWGGGLQWETALKMTFPDGNRDLVLHYVSHELGKDSVEVRLRDIRRDVEVTLHYTMDPATGVVGRSATISNHTETPLVVEQAAAATYALPRGTDYQLHYLTGRWSGEWQLQSRPITQGGTTLESRIGSTSAATNPWFAITRDAKATETDGDVWFGQLAWSGSWRITVEQDTLQQVRITGGFNPFDFGYRLQPGESLETPVFYAGHTQHGYGEASRLLHQFQIAHILPHAPQPRLRPVIYNSWEATEFDVTEQGQIALAENAARIGVERFVMDDGWFGQRKNDHAGLGDWYVNRDKFPRGLKPLIDRVHALKMDFGLWVEPEMVNPDSDLYRAHPDWVIHFPGRPETEARNQEVLNLAVPEVRTYVFHFLDELLKQNDIAFLKWDYNRPWTEPGWMQAATEDQKKIYVEAIRNLYSILSELRAKHPHVEIESCSSGGGRVDLGILGYTEEVWTSDNTDAFDRVTMQENFTRAFTPGIMMAWVTDVPNDAEGRTVSLDYRFLVAMEGALGVGNNLTKWSDADYALAKARIATYKHIRETVQRGALYRLVSNADHSPSSANQYVSADRKQAVLFTYLHSTQFRFPFPRVYLQGLDADGMYTLHSISGSASKDTPERASGAYWMHYGIDVQLSGDFQAAAFTLEQ
jgi:alpha-galactosidase